MRSWRAVSRRHRHDVEPSLASHLCAWPEPTRQRTAEVHHLACMTAGGRPSHRPDQAVWRSCWVIQADDQSPRLDVLDLANGLPGVILRANAELAFEGCPRGHLARCEFESGAIVNDGRSPEPNNLRQRRI